jgi:hypothetical protein
MRSVLSDDEYNTLDEAWHICREIARRDSDKTAGTTAAMIERVTAEHSEKRTDGYNKTGVIGFP